MLDARRPRKKLKERKKPHCPGGITREGGSRRPGAVTHRHSNVCHDARRARCATAKVAYEEFSPFFDRFRCRTWVAEHGAGDGTRTRNLLITNQLLYQLSYAGPEASRRLLKFLTQPKPRTTCFRSGGNIGPAAPPSKATDRGTARETRRILPRAGLAGGASARTG